MQESLLSISEWWGPYSEEFRVGLKIIGFVALAAILNRVAGRMLAGFFGKLSGRAVALQERRRIDTVARVVGKTVSLVILIVTAMVVFNLLGIAIGPILGAAGIVGIAVGFGAQSLVKDVFAGLVLLIENQIRVGDSVQIAGLSGAVEEISLRRVKLRGYDGSVHYISNGLITTVTNRSTDFAYATLDIEVPLHEDVERVLESMAAADNALRGDPLYVQRAAGPLEIAGIEPTTSANVVHARLRTKLFQQAGIRRAYLERLRTVFDEQGIAIPLLYDPLPSAAPENAR